jgi:hypothetical protein
MLYQFYSKTLLIALIEDTIATYDHLSNLGAELIPALCGTIDGNRRHLLALKESNFTPADEAEGILITKQLATEAEQLYDTHGCLTRDFFAHPEQHNPTLIADIGARNDPFLCDFDGR